MSKLDATGAKSLEEILASIRKTLSRDGSDASSGQRSAVAMPVTPQPQAPDDAEGEDDGLLSQRLAGALNGPLNGAAVDDDFSELLAPEHQGPAPSDTAGAAKPADAGSDGKDPLWFLRQPSAAAESNGSQAPTARTQPGEGAPMITEEVKLSRPEVLRASLPPLFGAGEERPTNFRAMPPHAPKMPDGNVPTTKMQPTPPPASEAKIAASSVPAARTQPVMPSAPEEVTTKSAPTRFDADASQPVRPAFVARESPPPTQAAPVSVAETAPGPQPLSEAKAANGARGTGASDDAAAKVHSQVRDSSAANPAPSADATQARTLEQVVGELLEPVIRHWLEANLPRMVEKIVRSEVARALEAESDARKA